MIDIGYLRVLLGKTSLNRDNNALYQLIGQLIDNLGESNKNVDQINSTIATSGDVTGPGISVDGQIALFDGATGKKIRAASGTGVVHAAGGVYSASPVIESDISLSNVTTNNVSITKHGFAPILPNNAAKFLDGTGNWSNVNDFVVMSDGGNPPNPVDDGAGSFIYIQYTP